MAIKDHGEVNGIRVLELTGPPLPSEYQPVAATLAAEDVLGPRGAMISHSKSGYSDRFPQNVAIFNANVCTEKDGKIWHGDLDVTDSEEDLACLAFILEQTVYVLYESDARFQNEKNPRFENAVISISKDGEVSLSAREARWLERDDQGRLLWSVDG